jgi:PPOX class probable F420-dependent enzyme
VKGLAPEARELIERPNYIHLSTLMPDGAPHSVAVWAGMRGDRIAVYTGSPASRKAVNMLADPRVAISVTDMENPYRTAQIRGRVVETVLGAEALAEMDRIAVTYTGRPFPMRGEGGVLFLIEADWSRAATLPFVHRPG